MKTKKTKKITNVKAAKNEKPSAGCSYVACFTGPNDARLRKMQAREDGRNEIWQSFQKIADILMTSGHYDESGFNLHDALSLKGDMEDADLRKEFDLFVKDLTDNGIVTECFGCMNIPQYQFKIYGRNWRTMQTDTTSVFGPKLR